jgi:aryl-alcohol dehydrogenase-like predicted oxidoreductase
VTRVIQLAAEKGIIASQLALAWVLSRGDDIVPIPGTKRRKYMEENVAAVQVKLSETDLSRIEEVAPKALCQRGSLSGNERDRDLSGLNLWL